MPLLKVWCEACENARAQVRLTVTTEQGTVLGTQDICSVCAREAGLQIGPMPLPEPRPPFMPKTKDTPDAV